MSKKETIEEFLARGGKIVKVPAYVEEDAKKKPTVVSTTITPVKLLSFGEADLFFGEGRAKKKKEKKSSDIDVNALPESIKKKYFGDILDD